MAINADEAENPDGEDSQKVNDEAWLQDLGIGDKECYDCWGRHGSQQAQTKTSNSAL